MFSFPGCGISAVRSGADQAVRVLVRQPITCWGLPRAPRRARPSQGRRVAPGHRLSPLPPSSGTSRAGGLTDGRTRGRRHGGTGAARRWNAVFSGERDFAPEWRIVWGGVSHGPLPPPPQPRAPFQALSGSFQNCALKFKEQQGACAVGRDNGRK